MSGIDWHDLRYLKIFGISLETILIVIVVVVFIAWLFPINSKKPKNGGENR